MSALTLIATFLLGGVPFGLILGELWAGVDVRTQGSGNIGATNLARVLGWGPGSLTLLLDALKGLLPVLWVSAHGQGLWMPALTALAAILGHCYSPFLEFKGGKGVATAAGVMLALSPRATAVGLLFWGLAYALSRRSSVGALAAIAGIQVGIWIFAPSLWLLGLVVAGILLLRHRGNLERLMQGSELGVR